MIGSKSGFSGSSQTVVVSTIDGATGQAAAPVSVNGVTGARNFTAPRTDSQNRVVIGVRNTAGAFVVTLGTTLITPVPSANPLVGFEFSLDAADRVISAHGSSIVASTLCTPFPTSPGFCRGWLIQKFAR